MALTHATTAIKIGKKTAKLNIKFEGKKKWKTAKRMDIVKFYTKPTTCTKLAEISKQLYRYENQEYTNVETSLIISYMKLLPL